MAAQVKSRKRVQEHGEVFTNEREVNAMLDMVKQETERIDSRFLEPACGNGNFLAEVLRRKLAVVFARGDSFGTEKRRAGRQLLAKIHNKLGAAPLRRSVANAFFLKETRIHAEKDFGVVHAWALL